MIACVIHGAKELKIENRPEPPRPQNGEVLASAIRRWRNLRIRSALLP